MSWDDLVALASERGSSALAVSGPAVERCCWWDSQGPRPIESMSVTKLVVGAVAGTVLDVEKLDAPVGTFVDEWSGDPRAAITPRQLMTHTSGLMSSSTAPIYPAESVNDLVLAARAIEPAGTFRYNNLAVHLVGLVIERATGRHLDEIAAERLFESFGFGDWRWKRDQRGSALCMAGLSVLAPDLACLGALSLTGGRHSGRQLVPAHGSKPRHLEHPPTSGCSASAKFGPERIGFGHDGEIGQFLSIQPRLGLVAVRQRARTELRDARADWEQFPGDVHQVYGSGTPR